jgi:hypothetical protein
MIGMFRTRDFVLLLSVIAFMVVGISGTILQAWGSSTDTVPSMTSEFAATQLATDPAEMSAVIPDDAPATRAATIERLRQKVAQADLSFTVPADGATKVENEEDGDGDVGNATTSSDTLADSDTLLPRLCNNYAAYTGFWDARDRTLVASAGQVQVLNPDAAVVLNIPALQAAGPVRCLESNVAGIANDASLIRNSEYALYSIFPSDVQIGYTLDGFPLYGLGVGAVDECGGRTVAGQYRYELSPNQQSVVQCRRGIPVSLN